MSKKQKRHLWLTWSSDLKGLRDHLMQPTRIANTAKTAKTRELADYVNTSGARWSGVGLQKGQRGTDYLTSRLFDNFARGRVIKLMITNDHVS